MPSGRSPGRRRCWPTCRATRIGWRSPTAGSIAMDERGVTFRWKDYRAKGRTRYKTMTLAPERVHAPLPAARAARRLPPHPALRAAGQRQPQGSLQLARELLHVAARRRPCWHCRAGQHDRPTQRRRPSCAGTAATRCRSCRPSRAARRSERHLRHERRTPWSARHADESDVGIGRVGSRVAPARVPSRRAPARRRGPRGPTHPSRSSRPPLNAVPQAPTLSSRVGHHSPNRHSRSELIDRAVLRRGFLPRGLCDTCPQVVATRSSERITGRCPTTLNWSSRPLR